MKAKENYRNLNTILEQRTEELEKTNLELKASNSELLQFASIASHDLKEPVRKIHMFSNLLRDSYLEEMTDEARSYIDCVIHASFRMTKLVNDLLSFTRLSGENKFETSDLNVIIEEVKSDLELPIAEKKAKIVVCDLPEIEIIIFQMRQVFQNIVNNALKFSRPDIAPDIRITAERTSELTFIDANDKYGCELQDNYIAKNSPVAKLLQGELVIDARLSDDSAVPAGTGNYPPPEAALTAL
jgi:two-component system, chemotaxis family, CheB/CheR fusion protein